MEYAWHPKDRLSARMVHETNIGSSPYLMKEEKELVDFLIKCSNLGDGKTRIKVLEMLNGRLSLLLHHLIVLILRLVSVHAV